MNKNWFKAKVEQAIFQYSSSKKKNLFERDRNRIIYSNAFRRLGGKTQIFFSGFDDNFRNRLTHTIEVKNIAQIIGSELKLDYNLIDAISLGHDIGHTPFGHMGENTINFILNGCENINDINICLEDIYKGFKHNLQGVRILAYLGLENSSYSGFDISDYTLWGILNHTSKENKECGFFSATDNTCNKNYKCNPCQNAGTLKYDFYEMLNKNVISEGWTIEGLVVQIADEISQRFHDIEDSIKANLLTPSDVVKEF